jgi:hypothetical protein
MALVPSELPDLDDEQLMEALKSLDGGLDSLESALDSLEHSLIDFNEFEQPALKA